MINYDNSTQNTTIIRKTVFQKKGQTLRTYNNKMRKHRAFYDKLYKSSQIAQNKAKTPKKSYFCNKYPTFEKFLQVAPIKAVNTK